jgi:putative effector of murein hydrolase
MMAVTAYMARAIQLLLGSSKRAMTERAEELGNENDNIPMTGLQESRNANNQSVGTLRSQSVVDIDQPIPSEVNSTADLLAPPRTQDPSQVRNSAGPPVDNGNLHEIPRISSLRQSLLPLTRSQRWAAFINGNIDRLVYLILFIFIGLPIYYTTSYAMPAQITFSILTYFAALALPSNWKKVLHPVLVSSFLSVIGFWIIGLIRGNSLTESLGDYKTGTRYIQLWDGEKGLQAPGAGDVFGTVLDASIVALALPMFQYRKELKQHFFAIFIPNITCSIAVLFGYPPICYAIGISSGRSLAFAVRSLTLALAKPAAVNLGGDSNTVAAICIMSGIFGALIGPKILQWLRIPEGINPKFCARSSPCSSWLLTLADDYVTRGVTLGGNSSAIATALLLLSDPRAAALSSLSMSLFGIITVVLTSVPPVVTVIRFLVGL